MADADNTDTQIEAPDEEQVKATNKEAESDADDSDDDDDEPFDLDRAKRAISKKNREAQGLRRELKSAKEKAEKWDQYERDQLSERDRHAADVKAANDRAEALAKELLHTKVRLQRPDLTEAQIKRLEGDTVEELVADAKELFGQPEKKTKSSTPNPSEVSGGNSPRDDEEEFDPKKLAAMIRRR